MRTWHEFLASRIEGLELGIPKFLEDKISLYYFCINNSIPTPKIQHIFDCPNEIIFKSIIEDEFVLKPSFDSSSRGVMVLNRVNNEFYNSLNDSFFNVDEIIAYQDKYFNENSNPSNKIIIQEKVIDFEINYKIPRDFKFYAFNGKLALILVIDRNYKPAISLWYDENFQPITDNRVVCVAPYARTLTYYTPPENFDMLIDFALHISKLISTPFASIDIYHSKQGPLLGEITLAPGGIYYGQHYVLSDTQEAIMGEMWSNAKKEIDIL